MVEKWNGYIGFWDYCSRNLSLSLANYVQAWH